MTIRFRPVPLGGSLQAHFERRSDGVTLVTSTEALRDYPERLTDRLLQWAETAPERTLVARRERGSGPWQRVSYAQALGAARSIAQALIDRGVSVERPVAILSENSIEHLLLSLGCMLAGVPFAPVSPAYSLMSQDFGKLKHILQCLTPGLVFAGSGAAYGKAIASVVPHDVPVVLVDGSVEGCTSTSFAELLSTAATHAVDAAHAQVGPDTIVKFLFTSGSTKLPKGVVNTQRMWCSNLQMIQQCMPALAEEPPVLVDGSVEGRTSTSFAELLSTVATPAVDAAHAQVGPDTIVKFLFTSGSTKLPKGVINTQRMWCSNLQMIQQCMPALAEEPPVLVDWLPWNHTFGGNHNVGLTIYNGGTLYIDDGKPTPQAVGQTLANLREIAPTVYFNVPKGYEEIAAALEADDTLRSNFFSRVKLMFFAGAGLSQPVWDRLDAQAEKQCGERIRMITGLGMTETAPFAICANGDEVRSGFVGLPAPGVELKLVPVDGKLEVRYRGANITPGYWRAPQQTAEHFDDEGFYCSGDALKYVDPQQPQKGFAFDGRIAEDFKLSTG
ncbi:MAG: hypothetical protein E6H79_02300, partial [Betaproteobacteria bacterium]